MSSLIHTTPIQPLLISLSNRANSLVAYRTQNVSPSFPNHDVTYLLRVLEHRETREYPAEDVAIPMDELHAERAKIAATRKDSLHGKVAVKVVVHQRKMRRLVEGGISALLKAFCVRQSGGQTEFS